MEEAAAVPDTSDMDAMVALEDSIRPIVSDDASSAFAEESYTWEIGTGKFDATGRPILLRVKVADPKKGELPTQYIQALITKGDSKAAQGLWQACIVEPTALKNPVNYDKTTTAFRATMNYRLLNLIGVNGDFFAAMVQTGSRTGSPAVRTSSTKSPASTVETPMKLSPMEPSSSTDATSLPTDAGLKTDLPFSAT